MPTTEILKDELLCGTHRFASTRGALRREKADLELLFEMNVEHSDLVADDLFSKLDSTKKTLCHESSNSTGKFPDSAGKFPDFRVTNQIWNCCWR